MHLVLGFDLTLVYGILYILQFRFSSLPFITEYTLLSSHCVLIIWVKINPFTKTMDTGIATSSGQRSIKLHNQILKDSSSERTLPGVDATPFQGFHIKEDIEYLLSSLSKIKFKLTAFYVSLGPYEKEKANL